MLGPLTWIRRSYTPDGAAAIKPSMHTRGRSWSLLTAALSHLFKGRRRQGNPSSFAPLSTLRHSPKRPETGASAGWATTLGALSSVPTAWVNAVRTCK